MNRGQRGGQVCGGGRKIDGRWGRHKVGDPKRNRDQILSWEGKKKEMVGNGGGV